MIQQYQKTQHDCLSEQPSPGQKTTAAQWWWQQAVGLTVLH